MYRTVVNTSKPGRDSLSRCLETSSQPREEREREKENGLDY